MAFSSVKRSIGLLFSAVGVTVFVAGLVLLWNKVDFVRNTEHAQGTVVDLERSSGSEGKSSYSPIVTFKTRDEEVITFTSPVSSSPPSFRAGEKVEVLYKPEDPQNAEINSFVQLWLLPLGFSMFGFVFGSIGVIFLVLIWRRNKMIAWLNRNGRVVHADFVSIDRNRSISVNGRYPFVISCQWRDSASNNVYSFTSEDIWFDPTPFVKQKTFSVSIDPNNPKKYWVDTSFLPEKA